MIARFLPVASGIIASLFALAAPFHDAHACGGGTFYPEGEQTIASGVDAHRIVISLSPTQTVLWDQITYKGNPKDFAWVMPVPSGSTLDLASDAWLEALDLTTATTIASPSLDCPQHSSSGCGCLFGAAANDGGGDLNSKDAPPRSDVTVVHQEDIGPYQTATIKSEVPGAIAKWLTDNGYKIPADVQPILDDYTAKGMDFIALRLNPAGQGIQQMQSVRVKMPGGITTFPMRMLSAGAQDTVALKVFVIAESRLQISGFPEAKLDPKALRWDFENETSNYLDVRAKALSASGGNGWLTTYAKQGKLLAPDVDGAYSLNADGSQTAQTIARAYFLQGSQDGDILQACELNDPTLANSISKVVDLCANGMPCATPQKGEIDARIFECDTLKDLSVALTGLHPQSVWLSRFEADMPRGALTADLSFTPLMTTGQVDNHFTANKADGVPEDCTVAAMAVAGEPSHPAQTPPGRGRMAILAGLLGVAAVVLRRARRLGLTRPMAEPLLSRG